MKSMMMCASLLCCSLLLAPDAREGARRKALQDQLVARALKVGNAEHACDLLKQRTEVWLEQTAASHRYTLGVAACLPKHGTLRVAQAQQGLKETQALLQQEKDRRRAAREATREEVTRENT